MIHPAILLACGPVNLCNMNKGAEVTVVEKKTTIGSIYSENAPNFCFKTRVQVRNAHGRLLYIVGPGSMCSALCCPCCGDDVVSVYRIVAKDDPDPKQVAEFRRPSITCGECCFKVNRFLIDFGSIQNPVERKLLFAAVVTYDLLFWEPKG